MRKAFLLFGILIIVALVAFLVGLKKQESDTVIVHDVVPGESSDAMQ